MKEYLLSLGSSIEDRKKYLSEAISYIREDLGTIEAISSIFYSQPWGGVAKGEFYNQSLILKTNLDPLQLIRSINLIEERMGRKRVKKWEDRIIDIDVILYKNEHGISVCLDTSYLVVPHKWFSERSFVWAPCCQIASDWIHPQTGKKLSEMFEGYKLSENEGFLKEDLW